MTRYSVQNAVGQRQRTVDNPLFLGTFSQTSLRYLQGTLQATYRVQSDGFGGGSYNHWFSVELTGPAWIILTKDGDRSKYVNISVYDLNRIPIEGRAIFQADSITGTLTPNGENNVYYPYLGHVMSAQSDLYNTFNQYLAFKGDDRYYPLGAGRYLICVSSTRNEPLDYNVGLVIEFQDEALFVLLEDLNESFLALEGGSYENNEGPKDFFLFDPSPTYDVLQDHEHSRAEWVNAWNREHQQTDRFPPVFEPLIARPQLLDF